MLEKQRVMDEAELSSLTVERQVFLLSATTYYLRCLQTGHKHDLRAFRLASLWFDNAGSPEVNNLIQVRH